MLSAQGLLKVLRHVNQQVSRFLAALEMPQDAKVLLVEALNLSAVVTIVDDVWPNLVCLEIFVLLTNKNSFTQPAICVLLG